jgi:hypothetical protein
MSVVRTKLVTETYDLGSLRLYREDLVSIATAVAEAGELTIVAGGLEATSPPSHDATSTRVWMGAVNDMDAYQGLDLGFLIDVQHDRLVRGSEVEPDKVTELLRRVRSGS